jgi:MFS family permease
MAASRPQQPILRGFFTARRFVTSPAPANGAPRAPSASAWATLFAALVAIGIGQTIVFAVLAPLGRELGLAEIQIGAIIAGSSLVFFIASPIWGRVSDRWGRKPVILVGLTGYAVGTIVFAGTFWLGLAGFLAGTTLWAALVGARMLQSTVMSATPPASGAYVADATDASQRTAGMGKIGAANNVGSIIGPALGGALAVFGLLVPLWAAAAITLAAAAGVAIGLPAAPPRSNPSVARPRLRYRDPRIVPFMVVGFAMFMGFAVVQQTVAFRIQDVLVLDGQQTARTVGVALMASALASLIAQGIVVQRFALHPVWLLRAGITILIVAFLLLAAAERAVLFVAAMGLMGFGMGLAGPGFTAGASLAVTADEQGAVAGLAASIPALGFTIGPLLGTALYQWNGALPYLVTAALFLPVVLYTIRLPR